MNLQELHLILEATGFPVAYSHFIEQTMNLCQAPLLLLI